jgi:chromosome partitioning protein
MIVAVFNPKGGVGKTTTAVNVSSVLARSGRSVLLVDLEADMNASISLGVRPNDRGISIADVLLHEKRPSDAVRTIHGEKNLHLITGSSALTGIDESLRHVRQSERRLADVIRPLAREFDVVMFDAPAGYSLISVSVTAVAQHLIVPIRAEYLALESVAQLLRWYRDRRAARKASAHVSGILLTMVDYRRQATREIVDMIRRHNRRGVFRTEIPQDPRVPEAPSHGIPLVSYSGGRATRAYHQFTSELLKRIQSRRR